jgi:hypothetical protein
MSSAPVAKINDDTSDEITPFTILACSLHVVMMCLYLYSTFRESSTKGPARFWRSQRIRLRAKPQSSVIRPPGESSTAVPTSPGLTRPRFVDAPPMNRRWSYVVLRSSQLHCIQTVRGTITGSIFFGQTAVMIVFLCLFFHSYTPRQHLIFMAIGVLAMASTIFFVQNLRMAYHLNYLVMVLPRKHTKKSSSKLPASRGSSGALPSSLTEENSSNAVTAAEEVREAHVTCAARTSSSLRATGSPDRPSPTISDASNKPLPTQQQMQPDQLEGSLRAASQRRSLTPPFDGMTRRRANSAMMPIQPTPERPSTMASAASGDSRQNKSLAHSFGSARHSGITLAKLFEETTALKGLRSIPKVPSALLQSISHTSKISGVALRHMISSDVSRVPENQAAGNAEEEAVVTEQLRAEEDLDFNQHEERLADVLKLMSGNFALGVRSMIFALPLVVGLFHDVALLITSAVTMIVLSYFDSLM